MKKYLVNRILRSIFSIVMVMILSVVLIFSLIPQDYVIQKNVDVTSLKNQGRTDDAEVKKLEVLENYGYIEYVSQADYCSSLYPNTASARYQACVARYDNNQDKQDYLNYYRSLGWEEVRLTQSNGSISNCDKVTRKVVEDGLYEIKEGQYYIHAIEGKESKEDELREDYIDANGAKKSRTVTYNNITYFRKNINPLKTFWNWFTGLITFDSKDKVDYLQQWNVEKETYETEVYLYDFEFKYEKTDNTEYQKYQYIYNDLDIDLQKNELSIVDEDTKESTEYISIAGISTGVEVGTKEIEDFKIVKKFNNEKDHLEGGSMEVNITFTDKTTQVINKEVIKYLKDDIPVYPGDDNMWYIGNSSIKVQYSFKEIDWAIGGIYVDYISEISKLKITEPTLERGYSIQVDEYGAPALTCVGCEHKYIVYFDNTFPYIHFNFVQFNLGKSILGADNGKDVTKIMTENQGAPILSDTEFLTGNVMNESIDFHTCTYKEQLFGEKDFSFGNNYANCEQVKVAPSRIAISFIIGILATIIAYFVGVPIGVIMARNKEKWIDKLGMVYIIVMFAVPSLAYIYFVRAIGYNLFNLPIQHEYGQVLTYILPIISLSLGSIASMMMWTRRYIVDQENSDYVKFARAKGLSESQIFFKHILRNAIVPIAHGIPGSIIGSVAGAMITEQVYKVEGTGGLMVTSIQTYNNWAAIGLIFFFSVLGIASLIMGDVVITLVDPRISFTDTGGRK